MGGVSSERGSWAGGVLLADTYLLGRRISRGGMGEVFEATHARLPGRFAVKILLPELTGHREAFARFCREAEVMSELRHPNVVQIFDFNTTPDGRPYFVMEFLEGRDLETRLEEGGPLPLPFAVRIVDSVCSALAAAHAHGIVHRDLKPANIFLVTVDGQPDELVKVLDFGISKVRAAGTLLSTPTDMLGTPPYMSPEQARGATHQVDGRTDQFALGAITYRMLTGHEPFSGTDIASLLYQVVHQDPPPLARYVPANWDTRALQAVLDRALAKDPAQRWPGMVEMARAFEAASEQTLSRLPVEGGSPDLASTLISMPPPPAVSGTAELRPRSLTPTPVVQPLMPMAVVHHAPAPAPMAVVHHAPAPAPMASEPTAPALVTDEPPPVRTPAPVVTAPSAAPEPPAIAGHPALTSRPAVTPSSRYDWEPTGSVDELPVQRRGLAVFAVLLGAGAVALAVTGAYGRIPGVVARVLHGRPAAVVSPAPTPAPADAPAPPAAAAPPVRATTESPAPPARSATPSDSPAPAHHERPARAAAERPSGEHRHRASRAGGVHYVDHPGSIELSPSQVDRNNNPFLAAPSGENAPSAPPASAARSPAAGVAPAPAAPSAGFGIEPPAPTTDEPGHDIAPPPPAGDSDQPLPPSVR